MMPNRRYLEVSSSLRDKRNNGPIGPPRTLCSLATLLSLALLALARQHAALREESFDAIIVLAGVD